MKLSQGFCSSGLAVQLVLAAESYDGSLLVVHGLTIATDSYSIPFVIFEI